jgi:hypothetical protein
MTTDTVTEPVAGYDSLKTKDLIASLSSHSQVELAEIEGYERSHQNREEIFSKLRWLRQDDHFRATTHSVSNGSWPRSTAPTCQRSSAYADTSVSSALVATSWMK